MTGVQTYESMQVKKPVRIENGNRKKIITLSLG